MRSGSSQEKHRWTQGKTWRRKMSTPTKVSPNKLEEAKNAQEYWARKNAAAVLKAEAVALDPSLNESSTTRQSRGSSGLADAYRENYKAGLEIQGFKQGLGEPPGNPKPVVSPSTLVTEKAAIIKSLASAGKTPEEIEHYLAKLGT